MRANDLGRYFLDDFLRRDTDRLGTFVSSFRVAVDRKFSRLAMSARHNAHEPICSAMARRSVRLFRPVPETKAARSSVVGQPRYRLRHPGTPLSRAIVTADAGEFLIFLRCIIFQFRADRSSPPLPNLVDCGSGRKRPPDVAHTGLPLLGARQKFTHAFAPFRKHGFDRRGCSTQLVRGVLIRKTFNINQRHRFNPHRRQLGETSCHVQYHRGLRVERIVRLIKQGYVTTASPDLTCYVLHDAQEIRHERGGRAQVMNLVLTDFCKKKQQDLLSGIIDIGPAHTTLLEFRVHPGDQLACDPFAQRI